MSQHCFASIDPISKTYPKLKVGADISQVARVTPVYGSLQCMGLFLMRCHDNAQEALEQEGLDGSFFAHSDSTLSLTGEESEEGLVKAANALQTLPAGVAAPSSMLATILEICKSWEHSFVGT